jgi:hypothetical protein
MQKISAFNGLCNTCREPVPHTASIRSPHRLPRCRIYERTWPCAILHFPSLRLAAEKSLWIVPVSYTSRKVRRPQPAKVILREVTIVHKQRQVCVGKLAALLKSSDKVTSALVQLPRGFVHCLVVYVEPVREIELDDDAVDIVIQIDEIAAPLASFAAQGLGDGLVGNGANYARNSLDSLCRVFPVLVDSSQDLGTVLDTRDRQSLGSNTIDATMENSKVVMRKQVVVAPCFTIVGEGLDISKNIKYAGRRLGTVIEQEHDPNVDCTQDSELSCHDYSRFLIRIVVCEVTHCCKQLICLVCSEDEVSTPDLAKSANEIKECYVLTSLSHWMCDHFVGSNNAEIISSSFERPVEIHVAGI